jgi:hypothetical protein
MKQLTFLCFAINLIFMLSPVQAQIHLDSQGNVGIGTTDPMEKLDVEGNLDMNQNQIKNMVIENRTDNPANPVVGQIWIRTDL